MGKKGARKESDDSDKKKDKEKGGKRRARPPDLPLMDLVEGCPPHGRLVFEWVVGNGIGDAAVEDAQAAFERAYECGGPGRRNWRGAKRRKRVTGKGTKSCAGFVRAWSWGP
ncbi:MAG: hypothetical protein IPK20_19900 [Betaproteobacteria bacterium]|nr:hypothetical protein [Betaproteobacteria bacterium]